MEEPGVFVGTIIWFDVRKGCGFIKPDNGGRDVFARIPAGWKKKELVPGQRVKYEVVTFGDRAGSEALILI
jgi:cold shock CspA family protein